MLAVIGAFKYFESFISVTEKDIKVWKAQAWRLNYPQNCGTLPWSQNGNIHSIGGVHPVIWHWSIYRSLLQYFASTSKIASANLLVPIVGCVQIMSTHNMTSITNFIVTFKTFLSILVWKSIAGNLHATQYLKIVINQNVVLDTEYGNKR